MGLAYDPGAAVRRYMMLPEFGLENGLSICDFQLSYIIHGQAAADGGNVEAVGIDHTLQPNLDVTGLGCHVVVLGKTLPSKELPIRWSSLAAEPVITRSSYGGVRPNIDLQLLARTYFDGRLLLGELIDERIGLEDINAGFAKIEQGALVRSVIDMKH